MNISSAHSFFNPRHPEGTYYRRGTSALAAGSLLMAFTIVSEHTAAGTMAPAGTAVAVALLGVLSLAAASAAIFLTAYLKTVPAFLKVRYVRRQGSLAGWSGFRAAADAAAWNRARSAPGRKLVSLRTGTW